jgi:dihydrofolate reductase/thymidylate synthase
MFNIILATDIGNGIGYYNKETNIYALPWNNSADLNFFKQITTATENQNKQNAVIMGYNTWISLPNNKSLNNRHNIVITSKILPQHVKTFTSFDTALEYLEQNANIEQIFVIGGAQLYNVAFKHNKLKYIYLTKFDANYNCNIFIDNVEYTKFKLISENKLKQQEQNSNITFYKYEKYYDETQYLQIMKQILDTGFIKNARNGNTKSLFGNQMVFNMKNNVLPVLTTKKIFLRGVFEELMFFLTGDTNTNHLKEKGINIWNANTNREFLDSVNLQHYNVGDIGTAYSFQFRHYNAEYKGFNEDYTDKGIDQFMNLIQDIITNRYSRRLLMTTYNPSQIHQGPLPPCHGIVIQMAIENDNELCCHMYQRSADWFLGVPWNITSYAILLHIVIELVNNNINYTGPKLVPSKLIMSFGDIHIYEQHYASAQTLISRQPFDFPKIKFNKKITKIEELQWKDIDIVNYNCHLNNFDAVMVA